MIEAPPILFYWDGDAFRPKNNYWWRKADQHFVVEEAYFLSEHHERSGVSHRHYHACIQSAFDSLPERLAERFPSPTHLRKYALIKAGYCDERSIVCSDPDEARRVGAFLRPMDGYAVITVTDAVVTVYTARSQSYRSMDKATFSASKEAVFDVLAKLIGTDVESLKAAEAV